MNPLKRQLPPDPLRFIQECVRDRRVLWTYHVNMRLQRRYIRRETLLDAVESYEIIESNPADKYLPSYLVLGGSGREVFHVLFAADLEGDNVRVITTYRPCEAEWESDWKTRRDAR